ncbi:hypothetical protein H5181_08040 [Shewanella sp. SG44-2]|uniref:hypothetical protein n=1 Tax=Shewanella TaxID=22 RepID=UPI0016013B92|nr:hypothetical protein [Shewanella sp. SG44-2]MBB1426412.1 hypothetical protein [Shewanella sp. SG44-2]
MLLIVTEQQVNISVDENYLVIKPCQLCDIQPRTPCLVIIDMQFTSQYVIDWLTKRTRSTLLWSVGAQHDEINLVSSSASHHCVINESVISFGEFLNIFTALYFSRLWDRNNSEVIFSSKSGEWESYFLNNTIMAIYSEASLRTKVEHCNNLIFIFDHELNIDTIESKIAQEKRFYCPNNISCFFNVNATDTLLLVFNRQNI